MGGYYDPAEELWTLDRHGYQMTRRRPLRLASLEALEAVVNVMPEGDLELRGKGQATPTPTVEQFLALDRGRLSEVTIQKAGWEVRLTRKNTFVSGWSPEWSQDTIFAMNRLSSVVEGHGRKLRLIDRALRRPIVEPRRRSEARGQEVAIRAAWIGAAGGLLGGALSGWLAAVATTGDLPWQP